MATMQKEEYKDRLRSQFDTALLDREEMEPDWMSTVRQRAMDAFEGQGFPTTRMEDWRYFNLSPLWQNSYSFQPVLNFNELAVKRNDLFGMNSACRMVFVNGRFSRELSSKDIMPKNLTVLPLSEAYSSHKECISSFLHNEAVWGENSLRSLNTAFMQDGALISIPDGMIVEEPIWLVFMAIPAERLESYQPRILVIAGENSQMTLIESHVAYKNGEYWSNPMVQLHAKQGAVIDHYKIQME
jgi:Fe-S cluster assembly protein SufD